jgi:transcription elongation factor GreA
MTIPMTPGGYEKFRQELERLKKIERPKNIREIEEARSHGDLSENAEYHAAKDRQGWIDARIREIETKIAEAEVIDTSSLVSDKVVFGATVTLEDTESGDTKTYTLVGEHESDLKNGRISVQSPVGRALIGRSAGSTVTVNTPVRTIEYEILKITFEGA